MTVDAATEAGAPADLTALQRQLAGLLRALWASDASIRAIRTGDGTRNAAVVRPFVSELGLHLPDAVPNRDPGEARLRYHAALAHAAAHLRFSLHRYPRAGLKPIQQIVLGLLEDARVERHAIAELPGLRALWQRWHDATPEHGIEPRILLQRMSRALLDPHYRDDDGWVAKARAGLFPDGLDGPPCDDPERLRALASTLGNDLGQMRLRFDPKTYVIEPAYRDDNALLWLPDGDDAPPQTAFSEQPAAGRAAPASTAEAPLAPSRRRDDDGMLALHFVAEPDADDDDADHDADAGGGTPRTVAPADDALSLDHHYPEWDYVIDRMRPAWTRVVDRAAPDPGIDDDDVTDGEPSAPRPRRAANRRSAQRVRERRTLDGEDLDVECWLRARIDRVAVGTADWRVWQRRAARHPRVDVLLLIDQSASTSDRAGDGRRTVLDHLRDAAWLAARSAHADGDGCAIASFCSNTRNEVDYRRIKDFDSPLDDACRRRLTALSSRWSTRFGAAIRHAARAFDARRPGPRLIVLVTDGQPHDVDAFDPRYLIEDARHAVGEARRQRIGVFCVTVDARADRYVERIFGRDGFVHVARPQALATWLPAIRARLCR